MRVRYTSGPREGQVDDLEARHAEYLVRKGRAEAVADEGSNGASASPSTAGASESGSERAPKRASARKG